MAGKTCLVTGATGGIGEVTARELARMGAEVVLAARSREKCEAACERIRQETGNAKVEYLLADLSSIAQIRRLAQEYKDRYSRLDVLVNNAGGFFFHRKQSVDGYEMTFALNHLGYFLLTVELLDVLKNSAPSRVVCVASDMHRAERLALNSIANPRLYNPIKAYAQTKLANLMFTYELARRTEDAGVTANALHPGFVSTNIYNSLDAWQQWFVNGLLRRFWLSPEEGARTSIYLASSSQVEGVTGKYYSRCQPIESNRASYDEEAARELWEYSLKLTITPGTTLHTPSAHSSHNLPG